MMSIDLKYPLAREQQRGESGVLSYSTGTNCVRIERDAGGGWWLTVDNHRRYWIPDDNVSAVLEVPDRYNNPLPLPSYAEAAASDGEQYTCKRCGWGPAKLHALRIHHGRAHRE